ncbi:MULTISPECIES: ATP-binding protein [unclassified Microbacterium]|uniref:ATP-binding protein n=1 Tax=unclassified Microbacterium TaxID=2609290 RepID=UPI000CFDD8BA|nr:MULTISPECIES: ATP-binding protein [unclassified Microbacterium]PQZ56920.1 ATP-binding protein [Microbacterium sp. MYb43]PQZ79722.1 ATP-binding protein [Microbacterium sp. MYb40]PRB20177.1 ATP-binding protein [Microbacterium sp. MYb54]PRB27461.1 ATP-binding protein [Microbacterium sp. MYb50]PRB67356.1 ATP-binding protein [Microbacterium sp. MYb24]
MPAEPLSIRDAWSKIPSPGSTETAFERFTGKRMERILAIVVAIGSAVLGAQALIAAMNGLSQADTAHIVMLFVVFVPLAAMLVACVSGRGVRIFAGIFAVVYVLALAAWPTVVDPSDKGAGDQPWIFFLVNVGVVAAMLAFPLRVQVAWAVGMPFVYGYVRLVQGEFSRDFWVTTAFDVSFTLILGVVIVSLGWMFRSVAAGVDEARGQAVSSYSTAAAAAAAEEERAAMSALMHDSVLAALIAAERAESERAKELAVAMAREALTRLANTEAAVAQEGSDEPVGTAQIVVELRRALSEFGADAIVEERGGIGLIPGRAARALVLAARQAVGNSVTHANGRGLHIIAEGHGDEGIGVTVSDTGPGFDVEAIGADRLGIRASIFARMAGVAGTADVHSDEHGTTVTLGWERS